jgi:hypothetical protein
MDENRTVLYIRLDGKLTAGDFLDSDNQTIAMFDSVDHPVDVIIDYTGQVYFSGDYVDTTNKLTLDHPNMRSVIFIGNKLGWELFDLYVTQYKKVAFRYTYAPTLEDALELIRQLRAELKIESRRPSSPEMN